MQVHEIKRDSTLQISLYSIHCDLLSDIQDPAKAEFGFCDGLIHAFVCFDTSSEILFGFFARHPLVIRVTRLNLECDVYGDDCWIVAKRLQEEQLETGFTRHALMYAISEVAGLASLNL